MRFEICCIFKPGFSVILVMTGTEIKIFKKLAVASRYNFLKCSLFHVFLFDILGISVKIGAHTVYEVVKCITCLYFHVNIRNFSTAK
jgi:hypothetical protein